MSTLNIDKDYREIVWKLFSICHGYDPNNVIGMTGFYIALIRQHRQIDYYSINPDELLFEQAINIDSQNRITIKDICYSLPRKDTVLDIIRVITSVSDIDHAKLFEAIISHYILEGGRRSGGFYQPKEITHFATSVLNNCSEATTVYNPFAGIGSYQLDNKDICYTSQELNRDTWMIGKLRMFIGVDIKVDNRFTVEFEEKEIAGKDPIRIVVRIISTIN